MTTAPASWTATRGAGEPGALREATGGYELGLAEHELVALWLLGRVPLEVLPWPLLRAGRAGRGPGPDVREASFLHPSGVPLSGDIEVHLRASDYQRHGHSTDPAHDGLVLHLVWEDDRPIDAPVGSQRGAPTALAGGDYVVTVEVGPALGHDPTRLRELVALGPSGGEPCEAWAADPGGITVVEAVRAEGRRRLAERAWGATRLVEINGWDGAWEELLIRALRSSAGRRRESDGEQRAMAARITDALAQVADPDGPNTSEAGRPRSVLPALERLASSEQPNAVIEALRLPGGPGRARAVELGWNAVLPLLAATAAAYGDRDLAARVATLVDRWPAPRPYGRTAALARSLRPEGGTPRGGGALYAQGLLHLQDLWCRRGGCGVCPLSGAS